MCHHAGSEEALLAGNGSINELVNDHEHAWPQILTQGAYRADRYNVCHAGPFQRVNVGAKVSDLRQSRRLEILSGSKPLGPSGDFCIDLISAIALISLSQHDLLSVGKQARFYGFS